MTLVDKATALATALTETLNSSITNDADLIALPLPDHRFILGHKVTAEDLDGDFVPVMEYPKHLLLRVHWRLGPSSSGQHLKTSWSQFGLYVWSQKDDPHPLMRLEVDAETNMDAWNVAHIHVHGTSQLLGQVWGLRQASQPKRLEQLHIPVGGFQYRPSLEDFIEFLIKEELVPYKGGWQAAIDRTRDEYRAVQLRSLIEKYPDVARDAVAKLENEEA